MDEKFDAIVVGAGLAGCSAALQLARAGREVVLVERGPHPGSKNLSGGVLYSRILEQLVPEFWKEAPVERHITSQVITFLTADSSFQVESRTAGFGQPPYNGFSVLRGKFDRWLGEMAEAAGAMFVPGIRVDRLLVEDGRVTGIVAGEEEMKANVVILADGTNSFLAQEAGLRSSIPTDHLAVGVKELIGLPTEVIEERFHLAGDEGTAYGIVGWATGGLPGGGFLYTNKESLSIGIVVHLDACIREGAEPAKLMEEFLAHPSIAPLIRSGKLLEYGAHLVPEGGLDMVPRLSCGGCLLTGDAAGLSINNGLTVRGMDLAIGSGMLAAETVLEAHQANDFSAAGLGSYQRKMENSFILRDMKTYAGAPAFMKNPRLYKAYPGLLTGLMEKIYQQDAEPRDAVRTSALKALKETGISLLDLARDSWKGASSL